MVFLFKEMVSIIQNGVRFSTPVTETLDLRTQKWKLTSMIPGTEFPGNDVKKISIYVHLFALDLAWATLGLLWAP